MSARPRARRPRPTRATGNADAYGEHEKGGWKNERNGTPKSTTTATADPRRIQFTDGPATVTVTVLCGDCRELVSGIDPVDSIVTDPPYGLAFMARDWDHAVPGPEFWAGFLAKIKPGGHLIAFGGTRTWHRLAVAIEDAGWQIRDCLMWLYGSGFPKSHNLRGEHEGRGTALKPAWEPAILARAPLAGTVAETVAAHGTGALSIDVCRIGDSETTGWGGGGSRLFDGGLSRDGGAPRPVAGRWPANLCLDERAAAMLDEQSGETLDSGGVSRFFYTAKASRSEREAGLEHRAARNVNDGRETSIDNPYQRGDTQRANTHPTVKPLDLMQWLVRLVTPKGGTVLDPFCGSGSTLVAADREGLNAIGIDINPEYVAIARDRVVGDCPLFAEVT